MISNIRRRPRHKGQKEGAAVNFLSALPPGGEFLLDRHTIRGLNQRHRITRPLLESLGPDSLP